MATKDWVKWKENTAPEGVRFKYYNNAYINKKRGEIIALRERPVSSDTMYGVAGNSWYVFILDANKLNKHNFEEDKFLFVTHEIKEYKRFSLWKKGAYSKAIKYFRAYMRKH